MRVIRPELELFEDGCEGFTYRGPSHEIADLPGVLFDNGSFAAVFELSDEERATIAAGGQFMVHISAFPIPPIGVQAVHVGEAPGEEQEGVPVKPDYRCRSCDALYIMDRALEHDFKCGHCGNELRLPGAAD